MSITHNFRSQRRHLVDRMVKVKTTPLYRSPSAENYRSFSENYPVKKRWENSSTSQSKSHPTKKNGRIISIPRLSPRKKNATTVCMFTVIVALVYSGQIHDGGDDLAQTTAKEHAMGKSTESWWREFNTRLNFASQNRQMWLSICCQGEWTVTITHTDWINCKLSSTLLWNKRDDGNIPDNGSFSQMPCQRIQLWWAVQHTGSSSDIIRKQQCHIYEGRSKSFRPDLVLIRIKLK